MCGPSCPAYGSKIKHNAIQKIWMMPSVSSEDLRELQKPAMYPQNLLQNLEKAVSVVDQEDFFI